MSNKDLSRELKTELAGFAETLASATELALRTRTTYVAGLRRFLEWLVLQGQTDLSWMSSPEPLRVLAKFVAACEAGLVRSAHGEPLTRRTLTTTIAAVNDYVRRQGMDVVSATELLTPNNTPQIPFAILGSELERWDDHVEQMSSNRDKAILGVMRLAGLRCGEVVALRNHDVIVCQGAQIRVGGKSGRARTVNLTGRLKSYLVDYNVERASWSGPEYTPAYFLTERGTQHSNRSIQLLVERTAKEIGLEKITPRTLRNTYATELIVFRGCKISKASEILGNVSDDSTRNYRRTMQQHSHRVADDVHRLVDNVDGRAYTKAKLRHLGINSRMGEWQQIADNAREWKFGTPGILQVQMYLERLYDAESIPLNKILGIGWRGIQTAHASNAKPFIETARNEIDRQWGVRRAKFPRE